MKEQGNRKHRRKVIFYSLWKGNRSLWTPTLPIGNVRVNLRGGVMSQVISVLSDSTKLGPKHILGKTKATGNWVLSR